MEKLERYGIRGIAHSWLCSYLDNRQLYIQLTNVKSDLLGVTCGVPQGSVLGPKLFILYMNDICNVSKIINCVLFADDSTLLFSGNDLEELLNTVQHERRTLKR